MTGRVLDGNRAVLVQHVADRARFDIVGQSDDQERALAAILADYDGRGRPRRQRLARREAVVRADHALMFAMRDVLGLVFFVRWHCKSLELRVAVARAIQMRVVARKSRRLSARSASCPSRYESNTPTIT